MSQRRWDLAVMAIVAVDIAITFVILGALDLENGPLRILISVALGLPNGVAVGVFITSPTAVHRRKRERPWRSLWERVRTVSRETRDQ